MVRNDLSAFIPIKGEYFTLMVVYSFMVDFTERINVLIPQFISGQGLIIIFVLGVLTTSNCL